MNDDEQDVLWSWGSLLSAAAIDGGPASVFGEPAAITQGTLSALGMARIPDAVPVLRAAHYCVSRADPGRREARLMSAI